MWKEDKYNHVWAGKKDCQLEIFLNPTIKPFDINSFNYFS